LRQGKKCFVTISRNFFLASEIISVGVTVALEQLYQSGAVSSEAQLYYNSSEKQKKNVFST